MKKLRALIEELDERMDELSKEQLQIVLEYVKKVSKPGSISELLAQENTRLLRDTSKVCGMCRGDGIEYITGVGDDTCRSCGGSGSK